MSASPLMMLSLHKKTLFLAIVPAVIAGLLVAYLISPANKKVATESPSLTDVPVDVQQWMSAMNEFGGKRAYELFAEHHSEKNINVTHDLAHAFGEALYKTEGIDGVVVCDSNYAFGCYHSFFGWALIDNGIDIISELDEACIKAYGEKGLGCQHGIGHGVLAELGSEKLNEALEACATLNWKGPVGGCTSGAFMEFNHSTMGTSQSREYDPENMHYPCTEVAEAFQQACYFEQPAWWYFQPGIDYKEIGALCSEVPNKLNREMCYRGTGNLAGGSSRFDINSILQSCNEMPTPEGVSLCSEGAAWLLANENDFVGEWTDLCEPLETAARLRCLESKDFI